MADADLAPKGVGQRDFVKITETPALTVKLRQSWSKLKNGYLASFDNLAASGPYLHDNLKTVLSVELDKAKQS
jgi:hypothetical protein